MSILRDIIEKSEPYWSSDEILLFTGARQAGKTTILRQIKARLEADETACYFLDLEDPQYVRLINEHPKNLFKIFTFSSSTKKKKVVFVDEVQYLENPSNFLKYIFDEHRNEIKLIVSGSSAFYIDQKFKDSLVGRKKIFFVPTLSFREFIRFKGEDTLSVADFSCFGIEENRHLEELYREFILFGGYPRVVLAPLSEKQEILREIAFSYIKKDVYESGVRQEEAFYNMFRLLGEQTGSLVNATEFGNTLNVSRTAIDHYLSVMQKAFIIHLIRPFSRNARKEITKMPKVYFLDLGLRNFFTKDFKPYEVRRDKGALLENAVFRQLLDSHYADDVRFWRTTEKKEMDFVVGGTSAIEVKANIETMKEKSVRSFREAYPEIPITLATLGGTQQDKNGFDVKNVWKL